MLKVNIKPEKLIWFLFTAVTVYELIDVAGNYFRINLFQKPILVFLKFFLPLLPFIPHAFITLGKLKSGAFLLLSFFIGLIFEIIGVKYGVIFGGAYAYRRSILMISGVPLLIPVYWTIFIYTGYSVVNLFLRRLNKNKPDKFNKNILRLLSLVALDGLAVLLIDFFLEPIMVAEGFWAWSGNGPYFGIPIGNFIGWFLTATSATGIFRIVEYFYPAKTSADESLYFIPLIGYLFIFFSTLF